MDFFHKLFDDGHAPLMIFLTLLGAHAVNSFPVPDNKYGRWLLGVAQWIFAFRGRSANTFQNQDTITSPTPKKNGNGNGTGNGGGSTGQNPIQSYKEPPR